MIPKNIKFFLNKIKFEIFILLKFEPILYKFLNNIILKHNNFNIILRNIIVDKFKNSFISNKKLNKLIYNIYINNSLISKYSIYDIKAIYNYDPTVNKYYIPLLYFKGFHILAIYRIMNWLWNNNNRNLAICFQNEMSNKFSVDIHPASKIGYGIVLDHAIGLVIGETTIISNNVTILHSVTLGSKGKFNLKDRHPKIEKGVFIGAGSKILGNIKIGKFAKIGAGSLILKSVKSYKTIVGIYK